MIECKKVWLVYESNTSTALDPEYLSITEDDIYEYMKENKMPEDPAYSKSDLILDLTKSSGFYQLPDEIKKETINYIVDMLNDLVK